MARLSLRYVAGRPSILLLCAIIATTITPGYAFDLVTRADTCPDSYKQCGNSKFPDSFCCLSSSTCMSFDNSSSVICCEDGEDCNSIATISCDVQQQNATLHPKSPIKTTRLDDDLPKCGDSCCPFGYECRESGGRSACVLDSSSSSSSSTSTSSTSTRASTTHTTHTPPATSATTASDEVSSTSDSIAVIPTAAPESETSKQESSSSSPSPSALPDTSTLSKSSNCSSFPTPAILAGFFPGAIFGAALAFLTPYCLRKRRQNLPPSAKVAQFTERTRNGTLLGISDPIPSEDTAMRTDFLACQSPNINNNKSNSANSGILRRASEGTRSRLHRTGSRVKSFLSTRHDPTLDPDVPVVPPLPVHVHDLHAHANVQSTPRPSSTESIRVYTPPGVFQTRGFLKPDPYPGAAAWRVNARPDTTFTEMIDHVGFRDKRGQPCYRVRDGNA
ncbi:uncharacterized protein EURHEDRAFT_407640 [Aspergillus ruber CBS 135680]|uniref:GPI transamidase component PIG-S n=1 Tax=Aspergillus ruber (strain CBS 135680) TaxID=1388766 RepID=A0A017SS89_ASPRC|nr:uncharacterized protein EURHEDRAFT_407640 [Aspergillus ruber CBS 135680]EYE99651.1 hypothetical protein EURHEDRAFT_407640 [Aspergillus ruber CBS 135680]